MAYFLQQLINGLTLGSVYGLIAIGYMMVYGIIGMINFAHGDIFMVGAFIALISFILFALTSIALPIVLLLTLLIAMVFTACYGWTVEKLAYKPLRKSFRLAPLISALGMSIVLQNYVQAAQGARIKTLQPVIQGGFTFMEDTGFTVTFSYLQIFIILVITMGAVQTVSAQDNDSGRELKISDDEKIILFAGFSIAVIAIFLFLARDIILRKKTTYDKQEHDSKKDRTYEKYHSDWGDDYEEIGKRGNTKQEKEFRDELANENLPDYYEILGVKKDATAEQIKKSFRELAKKTHPDKTKEDSEEEMIKINKAYEILSDEKSKEKYDRYFKSN